MSAFFDNVLKKAVFLSIKHFCPFVNSHELGTCFRVRNLIGLGDVESPKVVYIMNVH